MSIGLFEELCLIMVTLIVIPILGMTVTTPFKGECTKSKNDLFQGFMIIAASNGFTAFAMVIYLVVSYNFTV